MHPDNYFQIILKLWKIELIWISLSLKILCLNLNAHLDKFINIAMKNLEILYVFKTKSISKKENLLEEGQICRRSILRKGILRKFSSTKS
jgi:hypothetical protein